MSNLETSPILIAACSHCGAMPGEPCRRPVAPHAARFYAWKEIERALRDDEKEVEK